MRLLFPIRYTSCRQWAPLFSFEFHGKEKLLPFRWTFYELCLFARGLIIGRLFARPKRGILARPLMYLRPRIESTNKSEADLDSRLLRVVSIAWGRNLEVCLHSCGAITQYEVFVHIWVFLTARVE